MENKHIKELLYLKEDDREKKREPEESKRSEKSVRFYKVARRHLIVEHSKIRCDDDILRFICMCNKNL